MKKRITIFLLFLLSLPFVGLNAQGIGELAPEKEPEQFPKNIFGLDIIFNESGFGAGTFYRRAVSDKMTLFTDFSISESKDDREFQYYDPIYGTPLEISGKVNRVFLLPLNFGAQYRIFDEVIYENFRPYINAGVGPSFVVTTPYEKEFFNAFGYAKMKVAAGGYFGIGANFGLDKSSMVGINLRYYIVHFFDEGIVSLADHPRKDLGGFFLTINIGMMY